MNGHAERGLRSSSQFSQCDSGPPLPGPDLVPPRTVMRASITSGAAGMGAACRRPRTRRGDRWSVVAEGEARNRTSSAHIISQRCAGRCGASVRSLRAAGVAALSGLRSTASITDYVISDLFVFTFIYPPHRDAARIDLEVHVASPPLSQRIVASGAGWRRPPPQRVA